MDDTNSQNITQQELQELRNQYKKAKNLLDEINTLSVRYDAAFKAVETRNIDIEKISNDSRERLVVIENIKEKVNTYLSEIKNNVEQARPNVEKIDEFLQKIENIKGKIEGRNSEVEALVSTAASFKGDVENIKTKSQQSLAEIEKQFVEIQNKISQIQKAYEDFVAVNAKINDTNNGLQAILNQSVDLQKQSNALLVEIKSFRDQSAKLVEDIKQVKDTVLKMKDESEQGLKEINTNKSEVEKITALITDTGFANSFQKREKLLRISSLIWLGVFVLGIILLSIMLFILFHRDSHPGIETTLYRLTLTSPLLFLVGLAAKQYSHERKLNEKYASKAVIAAVIRNHTKFLLEDVVNVSVKSKLPETKVDIVKFISDNLCLLYQSPYEEVANAKEKLDKSRNKKDGTDFLEEVKTLQDLLPDSETFKKVLDLIVKMK